MSTLKSNTLFKIFSSTLVSLPVPKNLSGLWNFGSMLSMCLVIQIATGLLLAVNYMPNMDLSFYLVSKMMESSDSAWLMRYIHANGASLFFLCLYAHTGRGIYYKSFSLNHTWSIGVTILLVTMATAFLGYVLPINQMSYWGASVITNLFSEIPYIGPSVVQLIWGAAFVHNPTITRFFTFHFLLPFVIAALVIIHITFLHETGSNNPLGLLSLNEKIPFHPVFSLKDLVGVFLSLASFLTLCFYAPLILGDNENFAQADSAVTPHHIQPEWYFLFAYAILRSIPNKLGGVIALACSVLILYLLPLMNSYKIMSTSMNPLMKVTFWSFVVVVILLTWIGMRPVEAPYVLTGQILTILYFVYFMILPLIDKMWSSFNNI